ncbi:MAG TPA: amidohydrolase family protein [Acidimicrobiales bacterium]|jgi:N-acyl-D-aspartate/D-glutamate deacylase|nr:amidohydrolase family protein [Acidimicrobiales bacterium]
MLDCRISGGTVVDGTGATGRQADVGIRDGRIVLVGTSDEPAARTIDADGLVVAPGFVDTHTHLDAQLLWDPSAGPSLFHGVTTVIGGNCGFTIAPLEPSSVEYVRAMLARVEGMPLDALIAGPTWDWTSFGQWLASFDGNIALNAGFLAGHSTIRRLAMGDAAIGQAAASDDIATMCRLLDEAVSQGALGLSSSLGSTHHDGDGNPVPSRFATREEFVALSRTLRDRPGTFLGLNPGVVPFEPAMVDLITDMSVAARKTLTWNALIVEANRPEVVDSAFALADRAAARGGSVVAQVVPDPRLFYLSFGNGFILDSLPDWAFLFSLTPDERLRALADPDVRSRLTRGAADPSLIDALRGYTAWASMTLVETTAPAHAGLSGRTIGSIATEWGRDPFDTLADLVIANGIDTCFTPRPRGDDDASWRMRAELWCDPRTVIGAADAGAHVDNASSFTYTTSLIGPSVRDRGLLPLEEAVRQLTDVPARLCGLQGRGQVREGWAADLVVFDPARIGPGPVHARTDLPGGARRLYAEADGMHAVLVNGQTVVVDGAFTGELPGVVLRSGRDT